MPGLYEVLLGKTDPRPISERLEEREPITIDEINKLIDLKNAGDKILNHIMDRPDSDYRKYNNRLAAQDIKDRYEYLLSMKNQVPKPILQVPPRTRSSPIIPPVVTPVIAPVISAPVISAPRNKYPNGTSLRDLRRHIQDLVKGGLTQHKAEKTVGL